MWQQAINYILQIQDTWPNHHHTTIHILQKMNAGKGIDLGGKLTVSSR